MSEQLKNKVENKETPAVEKVEEFKASAVSSENARKLIEDANNAAQITERLSQDLKGMITPDSTKFEVEPKTESEKRLRENVGFTPEELASTKAEFAALSSAEAYNKFQVLSLKKTQEFLMNVGNKTLSPSEKGGANLLLRKIDATLQAAEMNKKDQALRSYPALMQHANKKADGYMALDSLSKLYQKSGYDDRGFLARSLGSSDTPFENFQKDLAENLLTEQQQEDIMMMAKEAERKAGNTASASAVSGMNQKAMMEPVFSRKTVSEIAPDKKIAA